MTCVKWNGLLFEGANARCHINLAASKIASACSNAECNTWCCLLVLCGNHQTWQVSGVVTPLSTCVCVLTKHWPACSTTRLTTVLSKTRSLQVGCRVRICPLNPNSLLCELIGQQFCCNDHCSWSQIEQQGGCMQLCWLEPTWPAYSDIAAVRDIRAFCVNDFLQIPSLAHNMCHTGTNV